MRTDAYDDAKRIGGKDPGVGGEGWVEKGEKRTVENFILAHAVWVPVTAEADDNEAVLFGHLYSRLVLGRRGEVWSREHTMAWSTCQPVTRWGRTTEPMMGRL